MKISTFITVVQRRALCIDESLLPLYEPLFRIETHLTMEERVELGFAALQHCLDTWDNRAMGLEGARDTFDEFVRNTTPLPLRRTLWCIAVKPQPWHHG